MTNQRPEVTRVDVLGVHVSPVTMQQAVDTIATWIERREPQYVCVTGAHGVIESSDDPDLQRIHNESGMTVPDGMPLVWSCRRAGYPDTERVYGPDLVEALAAAGAERGWRAFHFGGAPGVAEDFGATLEQRYPGFVAAGHHTPPFRDLTDQECSEIAEMIDRSGADLVFVGLSTPKQERFMARIRDQLDTPVLLGVGAAFDFHTGRTSQAPRWIQRSGFEWLYRAATEPKRLAGRYANVVPRFLLGIVRSRPRAL